MNEDAYSCKFLNLCETSVGDQLGADLGEGLWSLETPSRNTYIREAKRMMYWYKNTLKCIIP